MSKLLQVTIVFVLFVSAGTISSAATQDESVISGAVDGIMEAVQTNYMQMVTKLEQDGYGASPAADGQVGFVPEYNAFVRKMAFDAIVHSKRASKLLPFKLSYTPNPSKPLVVKLKEDSLPKEKSALIIAEILSSVLSTTRGAYTKMVVQKVKRDGKGASLDYIRKKGFVPLPAVFARSVGKDAAARVASLAQQDISVVLRSRWNLNQDQGLQDNFEKTGWDFLIKQQKARLAESKPLRSLVWEPFVKVSTDGGKSLRYLSADTAAAKACVGCHNNWEQKGIIQAMRRDQGVAPGKIFEDHELMGAISILVKLDK